MDGGRRWWLAELADEAHLRAMQPDWDAIAALAEATDSMGLFVYARSTDPVYYFAVRAFVGAPARFEDAASGAANATLAAWLAERGALPGEPGGSTGSARAARSATTRSSSCRSMQTAKYGPEAARSRWSPAPSTGLAPDPPPHAKRGPCGPFLFHAMPDHSGLTSTRTRMRSPGW